MLFHKKHIVVVILLSLMMTMMTPASNISLTASLAEQESSEVIIQVVEDPVEEIVSLAPPPMPGPEIIEAVVPVKTSSENIAVEEAIVPATMNDTFPTETSSAMPLAMDILSAGTIAPLALLVPTLASVPATITFASNNAIPTVDTTYTAQSVSGNLSLSYPALLSLGSLSVTVSLSTFTTGTQATLQDAQLTFAQPSITNSTGLLVLTTSNVYSMVLRAGGSSVLLLNALNISLLALGSSTLTWTPGMITLRVRGGTATTGTASATLTWTMSAI